MITKIGISGFKSIANADIELGKVNVLIGANGSGKTNFLEAIAFLGNGAALYIGDIMPVERGVRSSPVGLIKSSFHGHGVPLAVGFQVTANSGPTQIELELDLVPPSTNGPGWWGILRENLRINGNPPDQPTLEDDASWHSSSGPPFGLSRVNSSQWSSIEPLFGPIDLYSIFEPITPILRGTMPDTQAPPVGLQGGRLAEAVGELFSSDRAKFGNLDMDELLDLFDWVSAIDIVPPSKELLAPNVPSLLDVVRFTDSFMREDRNQLTGYDASEGALYVLFMLVLAMHPDSPAFFAVENFDHALNPRLARKLVRVFSDQILAAKPDRQVLLTTHNPLVLDGLDLRNDMVRLFVVERDRQGASQVHRVPVSQELLDAIERGRTMSQLWVMGLLGGVPDI